MSTLHTRRFLRTAAMLDSANEHERSTAARQASAMLREAGLDWTVVLKAGLTQLGVGAAEIQGSTMGAGPDIDSLFGDAFAAIFRNSDFVKSAKQRPTPAPAPRSTAETVAEALGEKPQRFKRRNPGQTSHVDGARIPGFVHGWVKILEDRRGDRTPALILAICDGGTEYGPMIAFAKLEELLAQAALVETVQGRVIQPSEVYHLPRFSLTV